MTTRSKQTRAVARRTTLFALAAVAALGTLPVKSVHAAPQEIIFAISAATGSLQQATAAEFTRRANEKLAGKAEVKLFDTRSSARTRT
ncbi:MAG: hypothetical protein R3E68_22915 [Burkholderiaceae bacterium]